MQKIAEEITDELARETTFIFDSYRRLQSTTQVDGGATFTNQLTSIQSAAMAGESIGSAIRTGPREGRLIEEILDKMIATDVVAK